MGDPHSHKTPRPPKDIFEMPPETSKAEWIRTNTLDFLSFFNLLYQGEILSECTKETCPRMTAGPNYEFLWAEDEYKNNPSSLPASVYIEKVRLWALKLLAGYKTFPVNATPPREFQRTCVQIWGRVIRLLMHIYWHHWETIVMKDTDVLLNNYTKHFIVFALKFKLLIRFDTVAPIFDLLGTILPANYHKQLQEMQHSGGQGKPVKKVKEKKPKDGRVRKQRPARAPLRKMQKEDWQGGEEMDFEAAAQEENERRKKEAEEQARIEKQKAEEEAKEKEEAEKKQKELEDKQLEEDKAARWAERAQSVSVKIPLEALGSILADPNNLTTSSPTINVKRSPRSALVSLPPSFNAEVALKRLNAMEEGLDDGEDMEELKGGSERLPGNYPRHSKNHFVTEEEMEQLMAMKEDERREWVKRRYELPATINDSKVRYEGMGKKDKNK